MRFGGLDELIARIKTDVGIAKAQLDMPEHTKVRQHKLFQSEWAAAAEPQ